MYFPNRAGAMDQEHFNSGNAGKLLICLLLG